MTSRRRLKAGENLGRYELLFPLASGGMGEVWEARLRSAHGFSKTVAVKTVRELADDPKNRRRFLDEARLAAAVQSPFVAAIFDFGEEDGLPYLVMERIEGVTLARVLAARAHEGAPALPPALALRIAADVAAGLHAAHEARDENGELVELVHRDVAPANLIITASGVTKLIDFGIAKARVRAAPETDGGVLRGRLRYMAPEQVRGGRVDRRADVWSLGVVLFEMLTGSRPFDDDRDETAMRALLSAKPLKALPSFFPPSIRAVVEGCLRYEPSSRFASALDVQIAVETALRQIGTPLGHGDVARSIDDLLAATRQELAAARAVAEAELAAHAAVLAMLATEPPVVPTSPGASSDPQAIVKPVPDTEQPAPATGGRPRRGRARVLGLVGVALAVTLLAGGARWLGRTGPRLVVPAPASNVVVSDEAATLARSVAAASLGSAEAATLLDAPGVATPTAPGSAAPEPTSHREADEPARPTTRPAPDDAPDEARAPAVATHAASTQAASASVASPQVASPLAASALTAPPPRTTRPHRGRPRPTSTTTPDVLGNPYR